MRPPPRERRIRVPVPSTSTDKDKKAFVAFAIDVRFGGEWRENDLVGCVYRKTGEIFVKNGDTYRPAAFLLGKKVDAVPGACVAAPPRASS
jgi:hypothetical protein